MNDHGPRAGAFRTSKSPGGDAYADIVHLENVVFDASDPQALGRFWQAALGTETLTDDPGGFETRLAVPDGPTLDLCFQQVPEPTVAPQRLRLDLTGGQEQQSVVERLVALGAIAASTGQDQMPWVVLADPEGNPFRVLEPRAGYVDAGPVAALQLDVADPVREQDFWMWLTGWAPLEEGGLLGLRHPSRRGPLLELGSEQEAKGAGKNRMHLDLRLGPNDDPDEVAGEVVARGGRELHPGWGDLPWRIFADPSGNEFCVLPPHG